MEIRGVGQSDRTLTVERQIAELDAQIAKLIEAQESRARTSDILCSMPGIDGVSAAAMVTLIGTLDRKRVASPITRRSGKWQGKAFIGSGRKPLRDALYMPPLVAMRWSPDLKAKYERMRNAGKPA